MDSFVAYHKALRAKNKLLMSGDLDRAGLETWNSLLARFGIVILRARREFVDTLRVVVQPIHEEFCAPDGKLELTLKSSVKDEVIEKGEEALFAHFMDVAERELRLKKAVVGPHRDELVLSLAGKEARSFASQGQTRGIVLALKLAVIHILEEQLGDSPVVLLDDVESELDARRKGLLFELVFTQGRQVFITGIDHLVAQETKEECSSFVVRMGKIECLDKADSDQFSSEKMAV